MLHDQTIETMPSVSQDSLHGRGLVRWNAIIAGALVALALWGMLYSFGLALGLSTLTADDTGSVRRSGIFTGSWSVLSPLIALFVGGILTSRAASARTAVAGAMHGLVMWSLSAVAFGWLFVTLMSAVVDGAVGASKQALQLGGQSIVAGLRGADAMQGGATNLVQGLGDNLGLDADDVLSPINARLKAAGRTPIVPQQLLDVAKKVASQSLKDGQIDRERVVQALLENTPLERGDAEEVGRRVTQALQSARQTLLDRAQAAKQTVQDGAFKTADVSGKAFWAVFTVLFMGMLAGIGGGILGVSRTEP